jgi:hypothetical protein
MAKVASLIAVACGLMAAVDASEPGLKPYCICHDCSDGEVVGNGREAALLGEAFLKIKFGEADVAEIKPIVAYPHDRPAGRYWAVFGGERSKKSGRYDTVFIDGRTGCLLFAYAAP